jgi:hypothetical protein
MRRRNMHPLAFLLSGSTSHHHGMWRHPGDRQPVPGPDYYEHVAIVLELGMFDALFFADVLAVVGLPGGATCHGGATSTQTAGRPTGACCGVALYFINLFMLLLQLTGQRRQE